MADDTSRPERPRDAGRPHGDDPAGAFVAPGDDHPGHPAPSDPEPAGPDDPRLDAGLLQTRILAGALAASTVLYGGIGWWMTSELVGAGYEPRGLPGAFVAVLAALALFDLVVAPAIERHLLADLHSKGGGVEGAVTEYRKAKLIGFAFREAAAVLGLLLTLFTGNPLWCYALSAATLVAMLAAWPSREGLERGARGAVEPR